MNISSIRTLAEDGASLVAIQVDDRSLEFKVHGQREPGDVASAALACLVYPAISRRSAITATSTLTFSPRLLANLSTLQEIYCAWYPPLSSIAIDVTPAIPPAGDGVSVLFSGGADAMYTYLENESTIDELIFCAGLDVQKSEVERLQRILDLSRKFATSRGKRFTWIETNSRHLWGATDFRRQHGQFFSAMGVLLGHQRTYIAASHSYRTLKEWGSHPLTDTLVSTESTEVIHHGLVTRPTKLRRISQDEEAFAMLRVCNASEEYNCGRCEKCLRTMVVLHLLGVSSPTLPARVSPEEIANVRVYTRGISQHWRDNLQLAEEVGDSKMHRAIRRVIHRFDRREAVKQLLDTVRLRG